MSEIISALMAGILASLSPCVYPLLPVTVGFISTQAGKQSPVKIILYFSGQCITMVSLGLLAVSLGNIFGFSGQSPAVQIIIGIILLLAGAFLLIGRIPLSFNAWNQRLASLGENSKTGLLGPLLLGIGSALLVSPCTSPILGSVLALMASETTIFRGALLMFFYSFGFSLIFQVLGLGFARAGWIPKAGPWMMVLQRIGALILATGGVYFLYLGITG